MKGRLDPLSVSVTVWTGWPEGFAQFVGAVNIAYGFCSGALALRLRSAARLPRWTVVALIIANSAWGGHCFTQAWLQFGNATPFGTFYMVFEGLWVCGLAYFEARMVLPVVGRETHSP